MFWRQFVCQMIDWILFVELDSRNKRRRLTNLFLGYIRLFCVHKRTSNIHSTRIILITKYFISIPVYKRTVDALHSHHFHKRRKDRSHRFDGGFFCFICFDNIFSCSEQHSFERFFDELRSVFVMLRPYESQIRASSVIKATNLNTNDRKLNSDKPNGRGSQSIYVAFE